jgi:peptide deformylase
MAILELRYIPDPVLRSEAAPVSDFNSKLDKFLDDMFETMIVARGMGLAAPQVGDSRRIAVIEASLELFKKPTITSSAGIAPEEHLHQGRLEIINPVITKGGKKVSSDEGCLSIPDYHDSVSRHYDVTITALDRHGREFTLAAEDILSFCIQHEIDHLNGILFTDHLSRLKKTLFRRWCEKHMPEAVGER